MSAQRVMRMKRDNLLIIKAGYMAVKAGKINL